MLFWVEPVINLPDKVSHPPVHPAPGNAINLPPVFFRFCETARRRWPVLGWTWAQMHQEGTPLPRPFCDKEEALFLQHFTALTDPMLVQRGHRTGAAQSACRWASPGLWVLLHSRLEVRSLCINSRHTERACILRGMEKFCRVWRSLFRNSLDLVNQCVNH